MSNCQDSCQTNSRRYDDLLSTDRVDLSNTYCVIVLVWLGAVRSDTHSVSWASCYFCVHLCVWQSSVASLERFLSALQCAVRRQLSTVTPPPQPPADSSSSAPTLTAETSLLCNGGDVSHTCHSWCLDSSHWCSSSCVLDHRSTVSFTVASC